MLSRYHIYDSHAAEQPVATLPWAWWALRWAANRLPDAGWLQVADTKTGLLIDRLVATNYLSPIHEGNFTRVVTELRPQLRVVVGCLQQNHRIIMSSFNHLELSHPAFRRLWQLLEHAGVHDDAYRCPGWIFDEASHTPEQRAEATAIHDQWTCEAVLAREPSRAEALILARYLHRMEQMVENSLPWMYAARRGLVAWILAGLGETR
jgi:hypothetical protein